MTRRRLFPFLIVLLAGAVVPLAGCKRGPAAQQQAARWHCPMHPGYTADRPGPCPICGMDLVPLPQEADPGPKDQPPGPAGFAAVTIDPQRQQLIGLRAVTVRRVPFSAAIRTSGRVTFDETRVHHVHTKYEAYVERLQADFTGKYVQKGEVLAALYSPDLLAAKQEYLLALLMKQAGGEAGADLAESARQKLLLWDLRPADIEALARSGQPSRTLNLYAPIAGYIVNKTAVHGMRVKPEDSLFEIVDLSRVWVLADIYAYELPRIKVGQEATVTLSYWPGRTWPGKVTYIYPVVDPKTRTIKVRLECDNPAADLKAELFVDVVIQVAPREALVVPEDAVVETGTRQIVFLVMPGGRLLPREIQAGDRASGLVEVRAGLREGDQVAAGANFLLDSESRLRAAISAMGAPPDAGHAGPAGHAGHKGPAQPGVAP